MARDERDEQGMYYFDENPKKKRRGKKRRSGGKKRRRSSSRGRSVTVKGRGRRGKSRSLSIRINPPRRHRGHRRFHSNPMSGRGFLNTTIHVFKRGAAVEGGRMAMGLAETFVPAKWNVGIPGTLVAVGLAGVITVASKRFLGGSIGEDIGVGAATRVIDRLILTVAPGIAHKTGLAGYTPLNGYVGLNGLGAGEVALTEIDREPGGTNYPAGISDSGEGLGLVPALM